MFAAARAGSGATARIRDPSREGDSVSTITAAPAPALDPAPEAPRTSPAASPSAATPSATQGARRRLPAADRASALVVDRLSGTHGDARLLARLAADELTRTRGFSAALYLADDSRGRCRAMTAADSTPRRPQKHPTSAAARVARRERDRLSHPRGRVGWSVPELRWTRSILADEASDSRPSGCARWSPVSRL